MEVIIIGKIILTDELEINILELPKLVYIIKKEHNEDLLNWLKFIKNPNMVKEKEMEQNKELKKAKEEYENFNQDEHEQYIAELRDRYIRETKTFYIEGVQDGIEQEKTEIAKKLLKTGMSIKQISEITELTKEEIEQL